MGMGTVTRGRSGTHVSARADWSIAVSAWKNIVPTTTSSPTLTLNHDDEVPSACSPRPTR